MEHCHGTAAVDLDCLSEVIDRQIVVTEVLIDETALDPHRFVIW